MNAKGYDHTHNICKFQIRQGETPQRFEDFPELSTKNQNNQRYENYRFKIYKRQEDTGFTSLVFSRNKNIRP